MSDTKKSTKLATKTETKSKAPEASATASADSTSTSASTESSDAASGSSSGGEAGKSARESVGGEAVGHYGFFSNVKTPEYKSGWDDIWGASDKSGGKKKPASRKKAAPTKKEPRVVAFDFEDLPAALQAALADAARAQLKKSRINYTTRDKAGAVTWRIECTVER